MQSEYAASILPFFIGKILKSKHHDIRYSCIKYLIFLVRFLLSDEFIYDSTILTATSCNVSELICNHLVPQIDFMY